MKIKATTYILLKMCYTTFHKINDEFQERITLMAYDQNLPQDPFILLSTLNMKLRNQFSDLEKLCIHYQISSSIINDKMNAIGFSYDSESNQFK